MDEEFPRRVYPCNECPVRSDNCDNPRSKFPQAKWDDLRRSIDDGRGGSAPMGSPLFGCHKGEPGTDADLACAGWLASFGGRNVGIRLEVAFGRIPAEALRPGPNWPPLYENWEEMVENQLWEPGDPADHLPESLTCEREEEMEL